MKTFTSLRFFLVLITFLTILQPLLYSASPVTKYSALPEKVKMFNADNLINVGKKEGIAAIRKYIDPFELAIVDSMYASKLIEIEFAKGFYGRHYQRSEIHTFDLPKYTLQIADEFYNPEAGRKIFEYYCRVPKFIKSDTLYYMYNDLSSYLKILVKYKSPRIVQRLKRDYYTWIRLMNKAPKKKYLTFEERRKISFEESMKFKPSDLYIDCHFTAFQIAEALHYMKIKGFDNSLVEELKREQSYPFAQGYEFPNPYPVAYNYSKLNGNIFKLKTDITSIRKDYKLIVGLIKAEYVAHSRYNNIEIIENGRNAYITIGSGDGMDSYLVKLLNRRTIAIYYISSVME
ncbi:MAG: hypothetical protein Q8909_01785 [Bacteroidota bacterium]|nr:hypothetical protein [Bacteroidota bacterium]